jgi:hypothetical protein
MTETTSPVGLVQYLRGEADQLLVDAATKPLTDENERLRREILLIAKDRQELRKRHEEAEDKVRHVEDVL